MHVHFVRTTVIRSNLSLWRSHIDADGAAVRTEMEAPADSWDGAVTGLDRERSAPVVLSVQAAGI